MAINRQLRVAQRKASRTVSEARDEAKEVLRQAKEESDKVKAAADAEYRERHAELQRQENLKGQGTPRQHRSSGEVVSSNSTPSLLLGR
jgi:ribonuclease Y